MIRLLSLLAVGAVCLPAAALQAQHEDIEFIYDNNQILFVDGPLMTPAVGDSRFVFGTRMETFPPIFPLPFAEVGFQSEDPIGPGDVITFNFLQSPTLGRFLTYWNPNTMSFQPTGHSILVDGDDGPWTVSHSSVIGPQPGTLGQAGPTGNFHEDLEFELSSANADFGAYGILFSLHSDAAGVADSDPFWMVFNWGMSDADFQNFAIPAFASIPEPGFAALALIGLAAAGCGLYRRRKT